MRIAIGAALLLFAAAASAQRAPLGIGAGAFGGGKHNRNEAANDVVAPDFSAAGKRDGDDKLTCEQLQTELQSTMASLQSQSAGQGASAEETAAKIAEMQQRAQELQANRPGVAGAMVKGMAQSMNPFGARKRAERQQAEMEAQVAEMQKMLPAGAQVGTTGPSVGGGFSMEVMARSQRINELGQQKGCDFLSAIPQGAGTALQGADTSAPPFRTSR